MRFGTVLLVLSFAGIFSEVKAQAPDVLDLQDKRCANASFVNEKLSDLHAEILKTISVIVRLTPKEDAEFQRQLTDAENKGDLPLIRKLKEHHFYWPSRVYRDYDRLKFSFSTAVIQTTIKDKAGQIIMTINSLQDLGSEIGWYVEWDRKRRDRKLNQGQENILLNFMSFHKRTLVSLAFCVANQLREPN
jgi:hypothetical protein